MSGQRVSTAEATKTHRHRLLSSTHHPNRLFIKAISFTNLRQSPVAFHKCLLCVRALVLFVVLYWENPGEERRRVQVRHRQDVVRRHEPIKLGPFPTSIEPGMSFPKVCGRELHHADRGTAIDDCV